MWGSSGVRKREGLCKLKVWSQVWNEQDFHRSNAGSTSKATCLSRRQYEGLVPGLKGLREVNEGKGLRHELCPQRRPLPVVFHSQPWPQVVSSSCSLARWGDMPPPPSRSMGRSELCLSLAPLCPAQCLAPLGMCCGPGTVPGPCSGEPCRFLTSPRVRDGGGCLRRRKLRQVLGCHDKCHRQRRKQLVCFSV